MKLPYFKITEAFNEAKDSFSNGSNPDKLASTAKLLGKSVANIGMLAVEVGVGIVKQIPEATGRIAQENLDKRSHLMTEEQVHRTQEIIEKSNAFRERRQEQEREAWRKEQKDE